MCFLTRLIPLFRTLADSSQELTDDTWQEEVSTVTICCTQSRRVCGHTKWLCNSMRRLITPRYVGLLSVEELTPDLMFIFHVIFFLEFEFLQSLIFCTGFVRPIPVNMISEKFLEEIWQKRPLGLESELFRIWWSKKVSVIS